MPVQRAAELCGWLKAMVDAGEIFHPLLWSPQQALQLLYGVGARLDEKPELLFVLRNVDQKELLAGAGLDLAFTQAKPSAKVIDDGDVAALFGLEMAEAPLPKRRSPLFLHARNGASRQR
jgi:hypothetical protein